MSVCLCFFRLLVLISFCWDFLNVYMRPILFWYFFMVNERDSRIKQLNPYVEISFSFRITVDGVVQT